MDETSRQNNVYEVLRDRGFLYQSTDDEGLSARLTTAPRTCYIGFDPTADSLHIGSLVPIMALKHMQRHGHRVIALVGGGTALVGDPSGKSELRQVLDPDSIAHNTRQIGAQLARYLQFDHPNESVTPAGRQIIPATLLDNATWLTDLSYIGFLRDIGRHFSVNRMLTAESYRARLETGLTFLEFNYMLLQAYDFMVLLRDYDCEIQMGGQDQWGNIVAGSDLCRRVLGRQAFGCTFPLLLNPSGEKFGKTAAGTGVWLAPERTSPFEFYQFWRNVEDAEVERLLGLFTLLPMEEVRRLAGTAAPPAEPVNLNRAKEILAFEATRLCHGRQEAREAFLAATETFGAADPSGLIDTSSTVPTAPLPSEARLPTTEIPLSRLDDGLTVAAAFVLAGLAASNGQAKKLAKQGGAHLNDQRVQDAVRALTRADFPDGSATLRAGKKRYHRLVLVGEPA